MRQRGRSSEGGQSASRASRVDRRSQDGSFDHMQQEIGLGFDPTKAMGRARSRPRDRSPAGPQSQPARAGAGAPAPWGGFPQPGSKESYGQPQQERATHVKGNVTHLPYLGPPSPRASPRRDGARGTDASPRRQTAADLAAQAISSVTGAFGNILSVPENAFGQASPGSAPPESQLIETEMRHKQLLASQKQM